MGYLLINIRRDNKSSTISNEYKIRNTISSGSKEYCNPRFTNQPKKSKHLPADSEDILILDSEISDDDVPILESEIAILKQTKKKIIHKS